MSYSSPGRNCWTVKSPHRKLALLCALSALGCLRPPPRSTGTVATVSQAPPPPIEKMADLDAWAAQALMSPGTNIGNTLDNTTLWETGWGNPFITKEYVQSLAKLGFKTVRLPVAWNTYAQDGRIAPDKLARVSEVVGWIIDAGMFCVLNIHWDGGWIDSDVKERYGADFHTFSADAEKKFRSYWEQISTFFAGKNEKLIFEGLNEETNFEGTGSLDKSYATLTRVNQLFIDTVRKTGGNNGKRLLIVTGYSTDFAKTCDRRFKMPTDSVPRKLFISVHYYTPWQFCGMTEDADWGKMMPTWGSPENLRELDKLFDMMADFATRNDTPVFIGELGVVAKKESASRVRWLSAVWNGAIARKMIPVLWDTGEEVSRHAPYAANPDLLQSLQSIQAAPATAAPTVK